MLDAVIKNATLIPMTEDNLVVYDASIGIKDGRIAYIGFESPEASKVVDAHGHIVMPGLVNAHAHTAMCVMRGYADDYPLEQWLHEKVFPVEARLDERTIVSGAMLGMAEMLRTGTTSFSDMYYCQPAVAKAVESVGLKANLCNAILSLDKGYDFNTDRNVAETFELLEKYGTSGIIRADVGIHAEYTSQAHVWKLAHKMAATSGAVTHIHLSETRLEHEQAKQRHGMTATAVFEKNGVLDTQILAAHGVWLEEDDMAILASHGASVAHCPVSNLKLGSGVANISAMLKAGVNVCLGTDGACSNNSLDLFEEIKLAALLAKGSTLNPSNITAYEALKLATVNGAKAQGRENEIGCIALGYSADIIMINSSVPHLFPMYDPISTVVYSARGLDVELTMVNGKVLYCNGEWTTIDVQRVISDVKECVSTIMPTAK